ncbi:hypothetical protein [Poseidonocella sp. HB161398]|uniref:hypothetical protein n=1 Tax=Poseidonocella sp. HB161398 TaxID=2320855 RepID=UPI001109B59C|nr:hypothetical protein [Poseidonocella sp. HB161398]
MLHFLVGLSIGLLIVSPVIALVLFAGLERRKAQERAPRKPAADVLPFEMTRIRTKTHLPA